ncbi:MAG: acyl carrier protein [Oscillospiraceae bacterium]|nr:acyl carrier protein [Oscillospiraceae bacterium]
MLNREEIRKNLNLIFQDVFDDTTIEITDEMSAKDIEDWDSLAQIDLIVASEGTFNVKFGISEIAQLKNIGDMLDLIERKLCQ